MASKKFIVIAALLVIATGVVAWFLWSKSGKESFGSDGFAGLGEECDDKVCCNGSCVNKEEKKTVDGKEVVVSKKVCYNVLRANECGCDDDKAICVAGARCKNNVCLGPQQKYAKRSIARLSMKQCKSRFFPKERKCNKDIDDAKKYHLPKRVDYSKNTRYSASTK